jgi:hypothetical protein
MLNILPPLPAPRPQPPSRRDNPFATCWTRPGSIAFRFGEGENAEHLIARLGAQNWNGAIVGPHGSGKSTLLEALKPALVAAGRDVRSISLHDGQRRLPRDILRGWKADKTLLIVDGYEQLSWWERWRLARRCRCEQAGLLITAHTRTRVPTLIQLAPDCRLVTQLAAALCAGVSTSITQDDVSASHARYGSNVREIFFDLYDRHERHRRRAVEV